MASPINFSGIASGIDTNALIQASSDARRATDETPKKDQVTKLTDTNTALTNLKALFSSLKDTSGVFTSLNGGAVSKLGVSSNESVVSATATNAASNGSYAVTVNTLAKNATFSFDDRWATPTDVLKSQIDNLAPAADRTISFTTGTGTDAETVNVVMTNTSTISDFVSGYNAQATKSVASLVNVGTTASPSYAIVINSVNEGTQKGQITGPTLGVQFSANTPNPGDPGVLQTSSINQAADANFSVSGVAGTITRSTNSVSDVITGVTLNLTSMGAATVKITDDVDTTQSKIQDFVDAFNKIVSFTNDNNQITRDESGSEVKNVFSPLASTRTDDNALTAMRNAIADTQYTSGSAVRIMADLGITTQRDGTLKFDTSVFQTALSTEPASVNKVLESFGDTVATTGGTIDQYVQYNGLFDITINGNTTQITDLNKRIADVEASISQQETQLRAQYASLEALMGRLQSQQQALTSALAGLG